MSNITNQELTLLRTQPHSTKLWLSIYQPPTVLAAQVNDSGIEKGDYLITYDSLSVGSHLLVQSGMTLWVGSAAGLDDLGKVRVRSATSSVLTVAENDHIDWADDLYLTVVSFFEINAVYPRIIQDPADELNVIFYKDYDIAYTDQNEVLGSFVCMGPHYAGFLDGGVEQVYYSASGTSNFKGDALTYSWFFQGATVTGSAVQNPGYVTYNTPGHYTTRLTVSNASGGEDVSYRHISIYDRPENGVNVPILAWEFGQLTGSRQNGGYTGRIKIRQPVSNSLIKEGSLVVIFSDDRYGETVQSIGGNAENRSTIKFVGYILEDTISFDYADGSVEFEVGSPTEVMKRAEGFSISVESKTGPTTTTWFQLLNMKVERALYHYLRWHSTCLLTMDVRFNGTDQNIQFFDADRSSIFDAVDTLIKGALVGSTVSDAQGRLYFEVEGYTAGITLTNTFTLDKQDWMGSPEIWEADDAVSFIEAGGIKYDGPTANTFSAFLASAPGEAPAYRGNLERFQGLALSSQSQLNTLLGDIFAWRNNPYPSNFFTLVGNYANFGIAPQEKISINVSPDDTPRGINFMGQEFRVEQIDWVYDSPNEFLYYVISFSQLTSGIPASTIVIPDVPPVEGDPGSGGGSFDVPPFNVPPLPFTEPSSVGGAITQIGFASHVGTNASTQEDSDGDMILNAVHVDPDGYITDGNAKIPLQGGGLYHVTAELHYNRTSIGDERVVEFTLRFMNYSIGALQLIFPTSKTYSVGKVGVSSSIPSDSITLSAIVDASLYDELAFSSTASVDITWSRVLYVTIMRIA